MLGKYRFTTVRYAYDALSEVSEEPLAAISVEMSELPEVYVIVRNYAYFADSYGYLMMCPIESVEAVVVDMSGSYTFEAINVKWADEQEFGANVPDEIVGWNQAIEHALTALLRMSEKSDRSAWTDN